MESRTFFLQSEAQTEELGKQLAALARKRDVFALFGTLGMGKSVLARAFIQSLVGKIDVPSPTFTLVQGYDAPEFEIYHFDLYRLKHPDEIFEIGVEEALYDGVSLIEWPEKMQGYLPKDVFRILIEPEGEGRKVTITVSSEDKKKRLSEVVL